MAAKSSPYFIRANRNSVTKVTRKMKRRNQKIEYDEELAVKLKVTEDIKPNEVKTVTSSCPSNWELMLNNIKEMRKERNAVVDSQGCERTADDWESPEVK